VNTVPIVPVAVAPLVMTGEAGIMVKVTVWVPAVGLAFDALTVALKVPPVVGVPEIKPDEVLIFKPGGKPLALNDVGLLLAVTVYPPNSTPAVPLAVVPLLITGEGGQEIVTVAVRIVVAADAGPIP
jgi:hypothetical protein